MKGGRHAGKGLQVGPAPWTSAPKKKLLCMGVHSTDWAAWALFDFSVFIHIFLYIEFDCKILCIHSLTHKAKKLVMRVQALPTVMES